MSNDLKREGRLLALAVVLWVCGTAAMLWSHTDQAPRWGTWLPLVFFIPGIAITWRTMRRNH